VKGATLTVSEKPNILWLTVDHQAFANHYDFQPQFARKLKTFERLRREGRFYDQAYTSCPLCTPARASMLSGRYPSNHRLMLNPDAEDCECRTSFDSAEELFAQAMTKQGYRVAQIGKWHVGDKIPEELGFEGWSSPGYGKPYISEEYREYLTSHSLPEPKVKLLWDAFNPELAGQEFVLTGEYQPFCATRELVSPKETHEAYFVSNMACNWLTQYAQAEADKPFVLKVDVWGPHHPYDTAPPFKGMISPSELLQHPSFGESTEGKPSVYAHAGSTWRQLANISWAQMSELLSVCYEHAILVDDALGRILNVLDELGLASSTVVVMTSDHGDILGAHGKLFNKENLLVEETTKVPLVIRWPKQIEAGEVCSDLVSNMDIPATVLAFGGAVAGHKLDGFDLLGTHKREQLMCQAFGCYKREFEQRMLRWGKYKFIAHNNDIDELYDLERDSFELTNLSSAYEYQQIVAEMQMRLLTEMEHACDNTFATALKDKWMT